MEYILVSTSILGFIGTLPQLFGSNWVDIYRYGIKGKVSWDLVHKSSNNLIAKMRKEGFNPTVLVGIGRGGVIAAGLVASEITRWKMITYNNDRSDNRPELPQLKIATINTNVIFKSFGSFEVDKGGARAIVDRISLNEVNGYIDPEDKVLLLVAQNFTGATLEKAISCIAEKGVDRDNIKTATLFWHKLKGVEPAHQLDAHQPDLFGMEIASSKTMPWKIKGLSTDRI